MANRISPTEAQNWVEGTKFTIPTSGSAFMSNDAGLCTQIEEEVIARVSNAYDTTTWVDVNTTPRLVRVAIAKKFTAWAYRRQYSESITDTDAMYAAKLDENAETIIQGIVDGSIEIPGLPSSSTSTPLFYPTDSSSSQLPTVDDPSLGPARFSMGMVF